VDTTELYARYKEAQAAASSTRGREWDKARARHRRRVDAAKSSGHLKRGAIRLAKMPAPARKLMYAAVSSSLLNELAAINKQYKKERQEIHAQHPRLQWADWLRAQAGAGDQEALAALRGRAAAGGLSGNTVSGRGGPGPATPPHGHDSVTKKGTVIYRVGASAVRDDGDKLKVATGADQAALQAALRMAIARYGKRLTVNGSDSFKRDIARAAAAARLDVIFDDAALQRRRQQLTQPPPSIKERKHDHSSHFGRGPDRGRNEQPGRTITAIRAAAAQRAVPHKPAGNALRAKPHARSARPAPRPVARDPVREVPERGVVHVAEGREVLLPGHVHHGLEQQGAQPDHGVRRDLDRAGRVAAPAATRPKVGKAGTAPPPASKDRLQRLSQVRSLGQVGALPAGEPAEPTRVSSSAAMADTVPHRPGPDAPVAMAPVVAVTAADKYISEREQKRVKGFDIPKHERYTADNAGPALYAGIRRVDGQMLALLKRDDAVMVLEVDDATAQRLKRLPLGAQVGMNAQGVIRKKGRSR
jgi:hypothetical protein